MRKAEIKMHNITAEWLTKDENGYHFVYDSAYLQKDNEDMALTLNCRTKKIKIADFETVFNTIGMDTQQQKIIVNKMYKAAPTWEDMIDRRFLNAECKEKYKIMIKERFQRIS